MAMASPDRLHPGTEHVGDARELLEGPTGNLGDHVVDRRFEAGRCLTGDVVLDLVQGVADGQTGGDLGDREPGRFGRQGARSADPRVHLDHDLVAGRRVDGELDVGAARLDSDPADAGEGGIPHALVFLVREGLRRGHRDRVAGVNAHRVEVLDASR